MNPVVAEIKATGLAHESFGETCLDRYGDQRFCGCLTSGLDSVPLTRGEWISIGQNLDDLVTIGGRNPLVIEAVQGCIR